MADQLPFDDLFAEQFVDANNYYRRKHGVPDLTLNLDLCLQAKKWADFLANERHLIYREKPGSDIGENITFFPRSLSPRDICDYWYKEGNAYEYETPGWQSGTNYFTQIVWKDTKEIGIGTSTLPPVFHKNSKTGEVLADSLNDYQVVVAFFRPSGNNNHAGEFALNVVPPLQNELKNNQINNVIQ
ncbi:unnamed protein product [Bursaphelenchus xylophilus]|uniref:(pine wood nematode) hypothetical protein n=1 Tax=Bursaphelenchus xylophilus TaxID=6326 RepID=A0A1I7STI5_BURXY|nr:unnamed protein product [Bursaphelenchus xylophilus]CAG9108376.1 unnamed protein product [Bursaphelenchus xylophilus]